MPTSRRRMPDIASPFSYFLAADARLSATDYADDQVWELKTGSGDAPALALQTRYGGRAGLVSLVPMWLHDGRSIYQAQAYSKPPIITGIAPGYIRLQVGLTPQLGLQAEYWTMESHAVGIRFTLANTNPAAVTITAELLGFVGSEGKEQPVSFINTPEGGSALVLGTIGNLRPVIVLEGAAAQTERLSHKLSREVTIAGNGKAVVRAVHAGRPKATDSLALAQKWLKTDWAAALQKIEDADNVIPEIETSDDDLDMMLAFAYRQLVNGFLKPTASLPHASFVAVRSPSHGFSPRGDGSDYDRNWAGQTPTLAYTAGLGMAAVDPVIAQGVIRNYLAVQQADGWIDWKPGLGGQKQGILCLPILARLSWGIFQYSEDSTFLRDVFPGLMKFFERWLQPDLDKDGDGLPEWQSENQTGYTFTPTFAAWQGWAQGADIRLVEAPDLLAYLISEARSLKEIAYHLRESAAEEQLSQQLATLEAALETLWTGERYTYRDRDSHVTTGSVTVIEDGRGADDLIPAEVLDPPNRLIVRVSGGVSLVPRLTMRLDGLDVNGTATSETVSGKDFVWSTGHGVYTSQQVFSQIDRITFEGLSRVYRVDVRTVDTTRADIHGLLPLWAGGLSQARAKALLGQLTDPELFWRAGGVTMCAASDPNFDPANAEGSGGVWPFWATLMGEALVELGEMERATELVRRLLRAQATTFKTQQAFYEFYHSEEPHGLGEQHHLSGIVPLHLLLRVLGVRIVSGQKVWAGGVYFWDKPVTVRAKGVTVQRSKNGTRIEFPSGHVANLTGEAWQEVTDTHVK